MFSNKRINKILIRLALLVVAIRLSVSGDMVSILISAGLFCYVVGFRRVSHLLKLSIVRVLRLLHKSAVRRR